MLLLTQRTTRACGRGAGTSAPSAPGSWEFVDGPWDSPGQRRVLLLYELLSAQLGWGWSGEEAARRGRPESSLYRSWFNWKGGPRLEYSFTRSPSPVLSLAVSQARGQPLEPLPLPGLSSPPPPPSAPLSAGEEYKARLWPGNPRVVQFRGQEPAEYAPGLASWLSPSKAFIRSSYHTFTPCGTPDVQFFSLE